MYVDYLINVRVLIAVSLRLIYTNPVGALPNVIGGRFMAGRLYPILFAFVISGCWILVSGSVALMAVAAFGLGR
jgi:hypothetical protein